MNIIKNTTILMVLFFTTASYWCNAQSSTKPNILWLVIEDTSPQNIGCYGDLAVNTPNIDKLAEEGVRFTNAYSTGTSCAPSRSTIITGVKTYKMGTGNQRSTWPIPDFIKGFPYYLKQAGYYTTNNSKTDYNTSNASQIINNSWNESSDQAGWWNRQPGQPFFAVFNYAGSHQSRTMTDSYSTYVQNVLNVLPNNLEVGENEFDMPPYLADNPAMRKEYARMYNGISLTDYNIGKQIARLEEAGLKDSTIIFFYADHGQGMPRQKCNESGQGHKVPFVIWFPEMYKHLSPWGTSGAVTSEQINFADLGPTLLSLAGVQAPDYFDGRSFMGEYRTDPDEYLFVSNDRTDNGLNTGRAIIKDSLIYIRNFTPFHPEQRYIHYFMIADICKLMYEDYAGDKLPEEQAFVFEKRGPEAFFNLAADTWEMNNLIDDPQYAEEINKMRTALEQNILESRDIMLASEYDYKRLPGNTTPYEYRLTEEYDINSIWEAASLSGFSSTESKDKQIALLDSDNDLTRYWAAIGLKSQKSLNEADLQKMSEHLSDSYAPARLYLASAIYEKNKSEDAKAIINEYLFSHDPELALMAVDNIHSMDDFADFGNEVLDMYNKSNGVSGLGAARNHAQILIYRLEVAGFAFSYGNSTVEPQDITDFESEINIVPAFGAEYEVVANPDKDGLNATENCGQLKRTSGNWWELIDIPCNFSIPAEEVAYLHVLVKYPAQPDIVVRLNDSGNESNIRAINKYTESNSWQDIVFVLEGGSTGLPVNKIRFMYDCGFQNSPSGFVLNSTDKTAYIDEIVVNNSSAPRTIPVSVNSTGAKKKEYIIKGSNRAIIYKSLNGIMKKVSVFDISGRLLFSENRTQISFQVPKSGLYIVKIDSEAEKVMVM